MVCFLLQCLLDPSRFHNKAISKDINKPIKMGPA